MLARLHIKQYFASVEHPQSNGQAESANKVILNGLKKRCEKAGTSWVEDLYQVLWSYRTTPHSSTGETPFRMVYGSDAVIRIWIRCHNPGRNRAPILEGYVPRTRKRAAAQRRF